MEGESSNQDIRRHIVNACIQWARIEGYSDSIGVLRGLAVLAEEPMSLDELASETGYSKSTVSLNMRLLENLGLVKRIVIPGDKRHLYLPIIDIDTIMANMLDAINKEIQLFCEALDRTEKDLKADGENAGYLLERVVNLRKACECSKNIIDVLRKKPLNEMRESPE
jgi:DNA-binding transcriptional regulator GbsR (MarR family)